MEPQTVLDFWFAKQDERGRPQYRDLWFSKDPGFDEEILARFYNFYLAGTAGFLKSWEETPKTALALILLFDQFPRNMFRGTALAYATDHLAQEICRKMLAKGWHKKMHPIERLFIYLPLEHSEDRFHQNLSVALMKTLMDRDKMTTVYSYALLHKMIIDKFGRFPHRNEVLGRISTEEEKAFLKENSNMF